MRHFFHHMLPPCCTASRQDQNELVKEQWIAISGTVNSYEPITLKDCLLCFDPVTQVYQQVEPVTSCEHGVGRGKQRVDLKSASQVAGSWDISSFEKLNSLKQEWLKWQRPIKGARGSWMALSTCLSFLSFLKITPAPQSSGEKAWPRFPSSSPSLNYN